MCGHGPIFHQSPSFASSFHTPQLRESFSPLLRESGFRALGSISKGIYVNVEEELEAKNVLNEGLTRLSLDPIGRHTVSLATSGSYLPESRVALRQAIDRILDPIDPIWRPKKR